MRRRFAPCVLGFWVVALTFAGTGAARAQQGIAVPNLPPITSTPLPVPGQALAPAAPPASPGAPAPAEPSPAAPIPPTGATPTPTPAPPTATASHWLPRSMATLQILNKVDATRTNLSIAVSKTEKFASLVISVEACLVRPPHEAPDSAAYVTIKDKGAGVSDFRGWLLAAEPGVSTFEHPIYDVQLVHCSGTGVAPAAH